MNDVSHLDLITIYVLFLIRLLSFVLLINETPSVVFRDIFFFFRIK